MFRIALVTALLVAGALLVVPTYSAGGSKLRIQTASGVRVVRVEIADEPAEQAQGLMVREFLAVGNGMLFVYRAEQPLRFWMKNMKFPLDMLWIGADRTIKHITKDAPPCLPTQNTCPTYAPPMPVQYVLEVPGGYAERFKVEVGNRILLPSVVQP